MDIVYINHETQPTFFFGATNFLLIIFASGLVGWGVHEFNEAGVISSVIEQVWGINGILSDKGEAGLLLKALVGYNSNPSLTEITTYAIYRAGIISIVFTQRQKSSRVKAR